MSLECHMRRVEVPALVRDQYDRHLVWEPVWTPDTRQHQIRPAPFLYDLNPAVAQKPAKQMLRPANEIPVKFFCVANLKHGLAPGRGISVDLVHGAGMRPVHRCLRSQQ